MMMMLAAACDDAGISVDVSVPLGWELCKEDMEEEKPRLTVSKLSDKIQEEAARKQQTAASMAGQAGGFGVAAAAPGVGAGLGVGRGAAVGAGQQAGAGGGLRPPPACWLCGMASHKVEACHLNVAHWNFRMIKDKLKTMSVAAVQAEMRQAVGQQGQAPGWGR